MQKYKEMVGTAEASLRNSGEKLIERFFDVDSLSPYLEAKTSQITCLKTTNQLAKSSGLCVCDR